jgi:catechol 2,3-dioxygenase-like lactoylglutathione lyase family enzyme
MRPNTTMRVARPTDDLDAVVRFYRDGLGLEELGSFIDHAGFDGVMLGARGSAYHLEFTHQRGHKVGRAPTADNLLVFYVPDADEWAVALHRLAEHGIAPVPSLNPYWEVNGVTFEDPDGYRVVLQRTEWTPDLVTRAQGLGKLPGGE